MQRVLIIGCGGAGKSTLARELGSRLGLPVHHLDRFFFRPGWVGSPKDEWLQVQTRLSAEPAWLIEGNYGSTLDVRLAACDTAFWTTLDASVFGEFSDAGGSSADGRVRI